MVYNQKRSFEFDPQKSIINKDKHGIDFIEAQALWNGIHLEIPLNTDGEKRWLIIGKIENLFWTAIITKRSEQIRIISVRRSRNEEKKAFKDKIKDEN